MERWRDNGVRTGRRNSEESRDLPRAAVCDATDGTIRARSNEPAPDCAPWPRDPAPAQKRRASRCRCIADGAGSRQPDQRAAGPGGEDTFVRSNDRSPDEDVLRGYFRVNRVQFREGMGHHAKTDRLEARMIALWAEH